MNNLKTIVITLITAGVLFSAMPSSAKELAPRLPNNIPVKSIEYREELGMYEVATRDGNIFYVTRDNRYAIIGNLFELPSMKNMTEVRKGEIFKVDFASLPLNNAVKISEGSKKIAVFTMPDCPWCKKLHTELKKLKDVSVYYFLVGNSENNKSIWCADDKSEALKKAYSGDKLPASTALGCSVQTLADNGLLAKKAGISGYPTIVTDDGSKIVGYVACSALESRIFKKTAQRGKN